MKLVQIEDLKGGEILARQVLTNDYQVLLGTGTIIKKDYIDKLKELEIYSLYIEDENDKKNSTNSKILKEGVQSDCLEKVKNVLEKHMYDKKSELEEINAAAEEVISSIVNDEHVIKKVYEIKERNSDIYEHSISVCTLSILVSLHLGIDKNIIHEMGIASLLHDLGLRYITVKYYNVDIETLSDKEKEEYKKHTIYGYSALSKEEWLSENTRKMILFHHERVGGGGYPLHNKEMPKEYQILALCEAFDELLCGVGCIPMKVHEVIEYIKVQKDKGFSAEIIDALLRFAAVYPTGTKVKLSNGAIGIVVSQNESFPERPSVKILMDEEGNASDDGEIINLIKVLNIVITEVIE